jgi:hypothetical protein
MSNFYKVRLSSDPCAYCGHPRSAHDTTYGDCVGGDMSCRCQWFDDGSDDEDYKSDDEDDYRSDYDDDN